MAEHTSGPWFVELTTLAGLRIVHGEADLHGFRDDVPVGLGKLDPTTEERANVTLKAAAPQLLDSLLAVEWAGSDMTDEGDFFDVCPNCGESEASGYHTVGCELRDSLDAALGVTSPRLEVEAHEHFQLPTMGGEPSLLRSEIAALEARKGQS